MSPSSDLGRKERSKPSILRPSTNLGSSASPPIDSTSGVPSTVEVESLEESVDAFLGESPDKADTLHVDTSALERDSDSQPVAESPPQFDSESTQRSKGEPALVFQPASDGLGFHPFSDGLPYSAASQGRIQKDTRHVQPPALAMGGTVNASAVTNRLQKALQFDPASLAKSRPGSGRNDLHSFAANSKALSSGGSQAGSLPLSKKPFPAFKPVTTQPVAPRNSQSPNPAQPDPRAAFSLDSEASGRDASTRFSITIDEDSAFASPRSLQTVDSLSASGSTRALEGTAPNPTAADHDQQTFVVAPRWARFLAYLLDSTINICAVVLSVGTLLYVERIPRATMLEPEVILLCSGFVALFHWALVAAQEVAFGSTLGKKTFGLSVQSTSGRVFFRALLFIPSFLLGGFGILWSLIDTDGFCLHDRIVGVAPLQEKKDIAGRQIRKRA